MNYTPPTLWDAGQIADYLRVDRRTVLEKYVVRPGFPKSVGPSRKNRLWVADEVVRYLLNQRQAA